MLPYMKKIRLKADELGIKYFFFFLEPFLETNWLTDSPKKANQLKNYIEGLFLSAKICKRSEIEFFTPKDGNFGDWYCDNEEERMFGAIRHSICCDWILNYYDYKKFVDKGKGVENQVGRTIHTLCNPLGLNWVDEYKICYRRGLIAFLFTHLNRKLALFLYTKVFRQKYHPQ